MVLLSAILICLAGCAGKSVRVNRIFLSKARAVSPKPLPHTTECALPGGKAPPGGRCSQPAAPQQGELTNALCFPSFGRFLPQGWALGRPASVKILSLCPSARRRTVRRREEVGFERRGLGFAFALRQQLPWQLMVKLAVCFQTSLQILGLSMLICNPGHNESAAASQSHREH